MEEKIGQLKKIVDIITAENVSFGIGSGGPVLGEGQAGRVSYLLTNQVGPVKRRLREAGYTLLDPMQWYIENLPDNEMIRGRRQIAARIRTFTSITLRGIRLRTPGSEAAGFWATGRRRAFPFCSFAPLPTVS